ncbi:MAG: hypothetical protein VB034_04510 [Eubacteriales bacterium]|nr:hypothetical protein [Eubacteriales bacterium]
METVLIILAIIWVVIPILAKNKQKQAKEQAERERAIRQRAAQAAAEKQIELKRPAQSVRTSPLTPTVRPSQVNPQQPSYEGFGSQEGTASAVLQGELPHDVSVGVKESQSSLRELNVSISHVVSASNESGHTHQETSATGIIPPCPPGKAPIDQAQAPVSTAAASSAFVWDPESVRNGLVMAEILGPCLALRD